MYLLWLPSLAPLYEATFVKACDPLVIAIVYSGSDQNALERFIVATDLKLDPANSGCHLEFAHCDAYWSPALAKHPDCTFRPQLPSTSLPVGRFASRGQE